MQVHTLKAQCSIPDCTKDKFCRGYCTMHHSRWQRHGDPMVVLRVAPLVLPLPEHMASNAAQVPSGCIEWTGRLNDYGYGVLDVDGRPVGAHRIAWKLAHGEITSEVFVLHRCDNRKCVNVAHLFLGDNDDNMADRDSKLRMPWGENSGAAKLTEAQVREIREAAGTYAWIASKYGVSAGTIGDIKRRDSWSHLPDLEHAS